MDLLGGHAHHPLHRGLMEENKGTGEKAIQGGFGLVARSSQGFSDKLGVSAPIQLGGMKVLRSLA